MKRPSIFQGVLVALAISAALVPLSMVASVLVGYFLRTKIIISLVTLPYLFYLLSLSRQGVGRLSLGILSLVVMALSFFVGLSSFEYLIVCVGLIWLVRSLLLHRSFIAVGLDAGLGVVALASVLWVWMLGGGFIIAIWCFLLVQGLFAIIPSNFDRSQLDKGVLEGGLEDRFAKAHRAAEAHLRSLVNY